VTETALLFSNEVGIGYRWVSGVHFSPGALITILEVLLAVLWIRRGGYRREALLYSLPGPAVAIASALVMLFLPGQVGIWTYVGLVGYVVSVAWRLLASIPLRAVGRRALPFVHRLWSSTTANSPEAVFLLACTAIWLITLPPIGGLIPLVGALVLSLRRSPNTRVDQVLVPSVIWILIAVVLAIGTGTVNWGGGDHAAEAIPQIISVQLALSIVPLTLAGVASQIVVTWMGFRGTQAITLWWIVAAFAAAAVSLAVDIWQVGSQSVSSLSVDQAETIAALVIVAAALAVYMLYRDLAPERIVTRAVRRLDREWLSWVVGTHGPENLFPRPVPQDRFYPLERLMYLSAVREGEVQLFSEVVGVFADRVTEMAEVVSEQAGIAERRMPTSTEAALDVYLAQTLNSMISDAARLRRDWALDRTVDLRRQFEGSRERHVPITASLSRVDPLSTTFEFGRSGSDLPAGVHLYASIAHFATDNALSETAAMAAHAFVGMMIRTLSALPDAGTAIEFGFVPPPGTDLPLNGADEFIAAHRQCFRAIRALATAGAASEQRPLLRELARSLSALVQRASDFNDPRWAEWLVRAATSEADSLTVLAAQHHVLAYDVPTQYGAKFLTTNPVHAAVVPIITESIVTSLANVGGLADGVLVFGAALFAQRLMPNFPEEAAYISAALEALTREVTFEDPLLTPAATQRRILAIRRGGPLWARIRFKVAFRRSAILIQRQMRGGRPT